MFVRRIQAIPIFMALLAMCWIWFAPWQPKVFYGDDLDNLLAFYRGEFASSWSQALTSVYLDKFRPVFAGVMHLLFSLFGSRIEGYLTVNLTLHALSGTLVYFLAVAFGVRKWWVAGGVALAFVLCRFSLYQVTQVTGLLEGVATLLFLCMLLSLVRASKQGSWPWSLFAFLFAAAATFTHERYIVVLPWLVVAFMLLPGTASSSRGQKLGLAALCISAVVLNVIYKLVFSAGHFFVGTGGTHMDFAPARVLDHLGQAFLSIFGFNHGPNYLVGANWSELPYMSGWILAGTMSLAFAMLMWNALCQSDKESHVENPLSERVWGGLLASLAILLLVPPMLTIRMEQRWELQPFILLLLLLAWAYGRSSEGRMQRRRNIAVIAVAAFSLASAGIDLLYSHFNKRIYMFASAGVAALVQRDVVAGAPDVVPARLVFLLSKDHCDWTLRQGSFFRIYADGDRPIDCVESLADVAVGAGTRIYADTGDHLVDVTAEWQKNASERTAISFDFVQAFDHGVINDTRAMDTPSGRGAVRLNWDSTVGKQATLVLLSGFSYRFDNVQFRKGDELRFGLAMLFPAPQAAIASVEIRDGRGQLIKRYSQDLRPAIKGARTEFQPVAISFDGRAEEEVSVIFSAISTGEDKTGQWVGFALPRVVQALVARARENAEHTSPRLNTPSDAPLRIGTSPHAR